MTVVEGDALETIARLDGPFDAVLIDAWKDDYPAYFDLVFPKLRVGGIIVADNISRPSPPGPGIVGYLDAVRNHAHVQSQLLAIGSGLEFSVKLAP